MDVYYFCLDTFLFFLSIATGPWLPKVTRRLLCVGKSSKHFLLVFPLHSPQLNIPSAKCLLSHKYGFGRGSEMVLALLVCAKLRFSSTAGKERVHFRCWTFIAQVNGCLLASFKLKPSPGKRAHSFGNVNV